MRKFGLSKEREHDHCGPKATSTYCNTYSSIATLLYFSQNLSYLLLNTFMSHITKYSTFKTFSADWHTRQYQFWIKFDTNTMSELTVAFLLHLIEFKVPISSKFLFSYLILYLTQWTSGKEKFDLDKMQPFLEVLKTFKFAAILVHRSHQSSLLFEWVVT